MKLQLSPTESFWFLPGKLHLSFSDLGPKSIDVSTLSDQERHTLNLAIQQKKLLLLEDEEVVDFAEEIESIEKKKNISALPDDRKLTKLASEILAMSIPGIKRALFENKHPIKLYKRLLEVERSRVKPRGRAIELIQMRLNQVEQEIAAAIEKNSQSFQSVIKVPGSKKTNDSIYDNSVVEEQGETVTVELG